MFGIILEAPKGRPPPGPAGFTRRSRDSSPRCPLPEVACCSGSCWPAAVNLAAGARRPAIERAILAGNHYAHADSAARAVNQLVPPEEPLAVVVYDGDMLDELDVAVWFDYRSKWLLYPRDLVLFRVDPTQPLRRVAAPGDPPPPSGEAGYLRSSYLLFFRATAPPTLPKADLEILAQDPMWILARSRAAGASRP